MLRRLAAQVRRSSRLSAQDAGLVSAILPYGVCAGLRRASSAARLASVFSPMLAYSTWGRVILGEAVGDGPPCALVRAPAQAIGPLGDLDELVGRPRDRRDVHLPEMVAVHRVAPTFRRGLARDGGQVLEPPAQITCDRTIVLRY